MSKASSGHFRSSFYAVLAAYANSDNRRMHEFSLRERIIVVDRNLWPSAVTMSRMNQLEIWLQALRSDFIFAARLYGPDKPIKRTWAYPAWPAEIESLSMQTITREVDGKLTDIVIIGFDPVM